MAWHIAAALLMTLILACVSGRNAVAGNHEAGPRYELNERGELIVHPRSPQRKVLATFNTNASTFGVYLVEKASHTFLVSERYGSNKSVVLIDLGDHGTYERIVGFSIDMIASTEAGAPQWRGVEVLFEPRLITDNLWSVVFPIIDSNTSERSEGGRGVLFGTLIPTTVYKGGKRVAQRLYFSPTEGTSGIDITRLGKFLECSLEKLSSSSRDYVGVGPDGAVVDFSMRLMTGEKVVGHYRAFNSGDWTSFHGAVKNDRVTLERGSGPPEGKDEELFSGVVKGHAWEGVWKAEADTSRMLITCAE